MAYTRKIKKINIDKQAFINALKEKGIKQAKLSEEMGYGKNYLFNKTCKTGAGWIALNDAKYIQAIYGIDPETYKAKEKPVVEAKADVEVANVAPSISQAQLECTISKCLSEHQAVDYERMYKVMYSAMYEAMTQALKGE